MSTIVTFAPTVDACIESNNAVYATAQAASSGSVLTSNPLQYGQQKHVSLGYFVWRAFYTFDTSSLPDDATIVSAKLRLYGHTKLDSSTTIPTTEVVSNSQASDTSLVGGDFDQLGSTSFASLSYASFDTAGYNELTLDSNGIAQINLSGYSKFGLRTNKDISVITPSTNHTSQLYIYTTAESGTSKDPELVIEYTTPSTRISDFMNFF